MATGAMGRVVVSRIVVKGVVLALVLVGLAWAFRFATGEREQLLFGTHQVTATAGKTEFSGTCRVLVNGEYRRWKAQQHLGLTWTQDGQQRTGSLERCTMQVTAPGTKMTVWAGNADRVFDESPMSYYGSGLLWVVGLTGLAFAAAAARPLGRWLGAVSDRARA